ncbi:MAG TPA: hypothetical protein VI837_02720 [Blastocatellia bacterium]|nr:hypothetical protein [Blastocatellia bacterium]
MKQTHQPPIEWERVGDIPRFPFEDFDQLKGATAIRSFNVGVDSLAAAKWSGQFNTRFKKTIIAGLSLLLVIAAVASVAAAVLTREYWLLAAAPIQVLVFYLSHPASPIHKWVTIGGAVSVVAFLDLLFNGLPIAAALVAYAGLTFAAVRAAGYITNSAFRKALLADEKLFLAAYADGACTLRNNQTKVVYSA